MTFSETKSYVLFFNRKQPKNRLIGKFQMCFQWTAVRNRRCIKSRSVGLYAPLRGSSKWKRACPWFVKGTLELPAH